MIHPIPYFSQRSRHAWLERGFKNANDAAYWEKRSCGIACLKMILDFIPEQKGQKFADIISEMVERGAYKDGVGWIHEGLAHKLNDLDIDAQRLRIENIKNFKILIDQGNVFVVSVGAGFNKGNKSGHLVLVVGYKEENKQVVSLIIHHTSSLKEWEWPSIEIDVKRFEDNFSGNAVRVGLSHLIFK